MKTKTERRHMETSRNAAATEILIQADGKILAHNLTPALAELLCAINPSDERMRRRSRAVNPTSCQ
jgi:hypothetical protein